MPRDKFLSLLGICRKAGRLSLGYSRCEESVKKGKAETIFIACDISPKTEKELKFITRNTDIDVIRTAYSIMDFSSALDIKAGVVAVDDVGFAEVLKEAAELMPHDKNNREETTYDD